MDQQVLGFILSLVTHPQSNGQLECSNGMILQGLKPRTLINMVEQRLFCDKASEDANAHLQHFLKIYNTFTI
jgi:hypothetical protein